MFEYPEPHLQILNDLPAGTMLYRDYGPRYWEGRESDIVEPLDEDGKSITLALTFELFDSFAARVPLIEARAANEYWTRRIWRHADTLTTLVIARAYEKARSTQTYAVQRVARVSKGELAAMSELHRGWVEEPGNSHPYYYVLYLIKSFISLISSGLAQSGGGFISNWQKSAYSGGLGFERCSVEINDRRSALDTNSPRARAPCRITTSFVLSSLFCPRIPDF